MSLKGLDTAKAIGARFRSARALVPELNRKSFCDKHGINRYTMQSWENGLHISKGKNVAKFIDALAHEGISCTSDWLFEGAGEPARPFSDLSYQNELEQDEAKDISDEKFIQIVDVLIKTHEQQGRRLVQHTIKDDGMRPNFSVDDVVFGIETEDDFTSIHQKFCIIELAPRRMILRKALVQGEAVLLMALDERLPTLLLAKSAKIYRVVWHYLAKVRF